MDCFFINLDQSKDRRATLEDHFKRFAPASWRLNRVAATTVDEVLASNTPGTLQAAEKACFLSHRRIIESQINCSDPYMIIEDDTQFGPNSFRAIEAALSFLNENKEWEMLFNDIGLCTISDMERHARLHWIFREQKSLNISRLGLLEFFAASSYVIHPRGARRLADFLRNNQNISVAVDTLYCRLIRQNFVQGYYVFPFATSISHHARYSLIQSENKSLVDDTWNFYRRLMWIDSDPEALMAELEALVGPVSPRSRACGLLWSKMIDAEFLHARVARAEGH